MLKTFIASAAVLMLVATCIYALLLPKGPDMKLALTAFSACLASYAAWQFTWREPRVILVAAVLSEDHDTQKRMLTFFNDGALPTCLRVLGAVSRTNGTRRYEVSQRSYLLSGHNFQQVPIILAAGDPLNEDKLEVQYVFYRGARASRAKRTVSWEGTTNVNAA
jgi:hypothetical protein